MSNITNGWTFEILDTDEERLDSFHQSLNYNKAANPCHTNSTKHVPQQVAALKSENAKTLAEKADWLYFKDQYKEAEVYYKQAIQAYGKNVEAALECSYNLAQIYEKQARLKEAEVLYKEIYYITRNIEAKARLNDLALSKLADIYGKLGRQGEAEALYMKIISKTSESMLYEEIQLVENCLNNFLEICTNSSRILTAFDIQKKLAKVKTQQFGYAL